MTCHNNCCRSGTLWETAFTMPHLRKQRKSCRKVCACAIAGMYSILRSWHKSLPGGLHMQRPGAHELNGTTGTIHLS